MYRLSRSCFTIFVIGFLTSFSFADEVIGIAIMGQKTKIDGLPGATYFHAGKLNAINDGDVNTRVDTWNQNNTSDDISYVGLKFTLKANQKITKATLRMATFYDGGWFGSSSPGEGNALQRKDLKAPFIQVTSDGKNWKNAIVSTDYTSQLTGHKIGNRKFLNPTVSPLITFTFDKPMASIKGLRIIGQEGGRAGGDTTGFIGVAELKVYYQ